MAQIHCRPPWSGSLPSRSPRPLATGQEDGEREYEKAHSFHSHFSLERMRIASAHILLAGAWAQGCVNLRGSWNVSTSSPKQIKANGCLLRNSEPPPAPRTVVSFDFLGAGVFDFTSNLTSLNLRSEMLDLFISSNTGGDVWGRTQSVCVAKDEINRHFFFASSW